MAYTVLARRYRSWTFDELIGQEAVATTLKNAIRSQRVHHGYLFCGTRGVGKTSAARILARSLNCLKTDAPTIEPCRQCESCTAIAEGEDVDVIEIDAASNTGVDNIRELRSNAIYRPARARFKIYIIDEVHMLSPGAFNALLKTLEEPPGHVKFIMATTEPQKVPATIQSRCLRFDFRSISVDEIARHLQSILQNEQVQADEAVVRRLARLANGSMRDGLSLLDQLLSMGSERLTIELIDDVLPVPHDEVLTRLIGQIAEHDAAGALASLDACLSAGYSLERFAESLGEQVRTIMLMRVCGEDTPLVEVPGAAIDVMTRLTQQLDAEDCVYIIAVLEDLRRNVRYSAMGRALAEAAIVRLASATRYVSVQRLLDEIGGGDELGTEPRPAPPPAPRPKDPGPAGKDAPAEPRAEASPAKKGGAQTGSGRPTSRPPAKAAPAEHRGTPPPPVNRGAPPTQQEMRAATSEPMVREALELFDGSLVDVKRISRDKDK